MTDGSGKNTAIIVALITVLGSLLTAVVANWDKIGPYFASNNTPSNNSGNTSVPTSPPPAPTVRPTPIPTLRPTIMPTIRPTLRPIPRPTASPDFSSIPRNSYRIGTVTIKNLRLNPMPPAALTQHQEVTTHFSYDVCCGATVRIWIQPIVTGSQCRYAFSPSPKFSGRGNSSSNFNLSGSGCASARVTGIQLKVKKEGGNSQDQTVIPVLYTFQ